MIINHWPAAFRKLYGMAWPRSYCCVDVETSGYSMEKDLVVEWGHVLIEDGEIVDRLTLVLDWTNHAVVPDHWLRGRINVLRQGMELAGKPCHTYYETMRDEGMKPDKALKFIHDFTAAVKNRGLLFVAHGATFDEKMLSANFTGFKIADGFTYGDNGFLDTEAIEKASQMSDHPRMHPQPNDTLRTYFHRVKYTRIEGLKSNLDEHCGNKYGFYTKHGIDPKKMHGAETDAYCCHLLMEEFRAQLVDGVIPHKAAVLAATPQRAARAVPAPVSGQRVRGQRRS